jgi:hypothetical protein
MSKTLKLNGIAAAVLSCFTLAAQAQSTRTESCDVVIAGGTTAALAAAITSAKDGSDTCLLEPFDELGGQLLNTPAIDHAWHSASHPGFPTVNAASIDRDFQNQPPVLRDWLLQLGGTATVKHCWVAGFDDCFLPNPVSFNASDRTFRNLVNNAVNIPNLRVFKNTVVRSTSTAIASGPGQPVRYQITGIDAVARTPKAGVNLNGFDARLSADIADWYSPNSSTRYSKTVLKFQPRRSALIVIDATELGDVLATSKSGYLVGSEARESDLSANASCGQAIVFPFFMKYKSTSGAATENAPNWSVPYPNHYQWSKGAGGKDYTWSQIWSYRRVHNGAASPVISQGDFTSTYTVAQLGDNVSLQNWTTGNDYPYRSLFKSNAAASSEVGSGWQGGIDLTALAEAEQHAIGWYYWMKARTPASSAGRITIGTEITGTASGLSKFPYLRTTRRSIGLNNFKLTSADFIPESSTGRTGRVFGDRVALANYALDIHPITTSSCAGAAGSPVTWHPYPFYIPFRALTNRDTQNLLVAGKTIAQSFWASTATRLQPEEFAQGQAAGAAASWMNRNGVSSTATAYARISEVQQVTRAYTPNNWKLP